jgi:hypothetical protein
MQEGMRRRIALENWRSLGELRPHPEAPRSGLEGCGQSAHSAEAPILVVRDAPLLRRSSP